MNYYFKVVAIVALVINLSHLLSARSISLDNKMLEGMIESSLEKMLKNEPKSNVEAKQNEQQSENSKYISYELNEDLKTLLKDELHLLERIQEQIKLKNISESEVKQLVDSLKVNQREARKAILNAFDPAVLYYIFDITSDNTLGFRKKRQAYGYGSDYSYGQPVNTFVQQPQFDQQPYGQTFMDNSYGMQQVASMPSFDQSYNYMQPQPQVQQSMDYGYGQVAQQDFTQYQPAQYQYQDTSYQPQYDQPISVQIETQQYIQPVYDNTASTYVQSINTQSYNDDIDIRSLLKNRPIVSQQSSYAPAVQQIAQPSPVQQSIYGSSASNYGPAPEQDAQITYEIVQQPQQSYNIQQDQTNYGVQQDQNSYGVQQDQNSYGVQQDQTSYGVQQDFSTFDQEPQQTYVVQFQKPIVQQASYVAPAPVIEQDQPSYGNQQTVQVVQKPVVQQASYVAPAPVIEQDQPSYGNQQTVQVVQKPIQIVQQVQKPAYVAPAPVQTFVAQAPVRQQATYVNTIQQDQRGLLRDEKIPSSVCPTGFAEPIYEGEEVGETYCRCLDGSYGFSCTEGFVNPCNGDSQFFPADNSLPRKYFIHCSWDIPYLKKCSGDLVWNNLLQTCDWNTDTSVSYTAPKTVYGY